MTNEPEAPEAELSARLQANCVGQPAEIAWPHRILHEAANALDDQAACIAELEAERDEALNQLDSERHSIETLERRNAEVLARAKAAEAKLTDCDPYLKDHEAPAQRLESNHKETLSLMKLLEQEKRHSEVWVKAARVAEAKLAKAYEEQVRLEAKLAKAEDGLRECEQEIDGYIWQEYPFDHPVHERYRQRDFSANPARSTLAELKGTAL